MMKTTGQKIKVLVFAMVFCFCLWGAFACSANLILQPSHGGDGSAWAKKQCDSCHLVNLIHSNTAENLRNLVREKSYASCAGCHGNNGTNTSRQCTLCHNDTDLAYASGQQGEKSHNFIPANQQQNSALKDQDCLSCHISSDMNGQFDLNIDLSVFSNQQNVNSKYQKSSDFCLACHNRDFQQAGFEITGKNYRDPLIAMQDNYSFIDKHGVPKGSGLRTFSGLRAAYSYPAEVTCTDCHAMHATHNGSLIIANASHGASRLSTSIKQQNIDINTNNGQLAQLCVICHAMENQQDEAQIDTGNGLSGVHQARGDCLDCHRHGMAVQTGL
ncbi:MAG: cytochrome c3 family protein [Pseudomonadota bacterium]